MFLFLYTKKIVYNKFIIVCVFFEKNKHTNNANTKNLPLTPRGRKKKVCDEVDIFELREGVDDDLYLIRL